jgi:hypothetical protein
LKPGVWSRTLRISTAFFSRTSRSGPKNLYGEGRFEAGKGFIHGVFSRLRVIEDYPGIGFEFALNVFFEFRLAANRGLAPGFVVVRLEAYIKFTVEKSGGVGAVIGAPEFRADDGDHRILVENFADFGRELGGFFKRNGVGHSSANPECGFIEMRQKFATKPMERRLAASPVR